MKHSHVGMVGVGMVCVLASGCFLFRVPDLSPEEAAKIISEAPEFNRYERLVEVENVDHCKDSMDTVSYGYFTFRYLNSPPGARPIHAQADFRYIQGKWYLNGFWWGGRGDFHSVNVYDGPEKRRRTSGFPPEDAN